jgi:hypothetical protein
MKFLIEQGALAATPLLIAASVVLAGSVACALSLVAEWVCRRRPAPRRHGLLLAGLVMVTAAPILVGVAQWAGWGLVAVSVPRAPVANKPADLLSPAADTTTPLCAAGLLTRRERASTSRQDAFSARWVRRPTAHEAMGPLGNNVSPQNPDGPAWWQRAGTALVLAWGAGAAAALLRLVLGFLRLARLGRTLVPLNHPTAARAARRAADLLHLRHTPMIWSAPAAPAPMVIGLWRPRIVLPTGLVADLSDEQWHAVVLHEAAHIARGDLGVGLLQRLAAALFWWCPLLHVLNRRLGELREELCDNHVIREQGDGFGLAQVLVGLAERRRCGDRMELAGAMAVAEPAGPGLEKRIRRLLQKEQDMTTRIDLRGIVQALALGALIGMAALLATARAEDQAPAVANPADADVQPPKVKAAQPADADVQPPKIKAAQPADAEVKPPKVKAAQPADADVKPPKVKAAQAPTLGAVVKSVDAVAATITVAIKGKEKGPPTERTLALAKDVKVTLLVRKDKGPQPEGTLLDLPEGAPVSLLLSTDETTVVGISVQGRSLNAAVKSVDADKRTITVVRVSKGAQGAVEDTFTVAEDVKVFVSDPKVKGKREEHKLADLTEGTLVTLQFSPAARTTVTGITASGSTITAVVQSFDADKSTITIQWGDKEQTLAVAKDVKVVVSDGDKEEGLPAEGTLSDLVGMKVSLYVSVFEPKTVTAIRLTRGKGLAKDGK